MQNSSNVEDAKKPIINYSTYFTYLTRSFILLFSKNVSHELISLTITLKIWQKIPKIIPKREVRNGQKWKKSVPIILSVWESSSDSLVFLYCRRDFFPHFLCHVSKCQFVVLSFAHFSLRKYFILRIFQSHINFI